MARVAIRFAVAVYVTWLTGCGTVRNLGSEECVPYGGVSRDVAGLERMIRGDDRHGCGAYLLLVYEMMWAGVFSSVAVDAPLSVVADSLTLPWTVMASLTRPSVPAPVVESATRPLPLPPSPADSPAGSTLEAVARSAP